MAALLAVSRGCNQDVLQETYKKASDVVGKSLHAFSCLHGFVQHTFSCSHLLSRMHFPSFFHSPPPPSISFSCSYNYWCGMVLPFLPLSLPCREGATCLALKVRMIKTFSHQDSLWPDCSWGFSAIYFPEICIQQVAGFEDQKSPESSVAVGQWVFQCYERGKNGVKKSVDSKGLLSRGLYLCIAIFLNKMLPRGFLSIICK